MEEGLQTPQMECGLSQKARGPRIWSSQFLQGWVISQANESEEYSKYFGKGWNFQELGPHPLLALYGQPQNYHGACGYVIQLPDVLQ